MVAIVQHILDSKIEQDEEIQSYIFFLFSSSNFFLIFIKNIDGINIFNHEYLYILPMLTTQHLF